MTPRPQAPAVWLRLLRRATHPADRRWVVEDALEEFETRAAREGERAARAWLRRQAVSAIVPGVRERWRRRGRPGATAGPGRSGPLEGVGRDLAYAFRSLRRSPGLVATVVGSLGIGIAGATLVFSITRSFLSPAPGPITEPERLVTIYESDLEGTPWGQVAFPNVADLREAVPALTDVAASRIGVVRIGEPDASGVGAREPLIVELVTGNWFDVLGIPTVLGRSFAEEETRLGAAERLFVMGHEYWERAFASDPGIVGRTVVLDGAPHTVIGVAAPGVANRALQLRVAGWVPLGIPGGTYNATEDELGNRADREYLVLGRMAPGATFEQVEREVAGVGAGLAETFPDVWRDDRGEVRRFSVLPEERSRVAPEFRTASALLVGLLFAGTGLILLIACSNVAGLLLARGQRRLAEVAVRVSIGASPGRVVRMLVTESLLLAVAGSLLAAALTWAAVSRGATIPLPGGLPDLAFDLRVDPWVLAFSLGLGTVCALLFGLAPALRVTRAGGSLAKGMRGATVSGRARRGLVRLQVAGTAVFLLGAGLLLRSVGHIDTSDPGLRYGHLSVANWKADADPDPEWRTALLENVLARPEIDRAELASAVEVSPFFDLTVARLLLPGADEAVVVPLNTVTPGYADLVGLELLRGRWLDDRDVAGGLTALVVNEAFVRRWFPDGDAVGRTLRIQEVREISTPLPDSDFSALIVGVVRDVRNVPIEAPEPYAWATLAQIPVSNVVVHAAGPRGAGAALGGLSRVIGDRLTLVGPSTYGEMAASNTLGQRALVGVLAAAAGFGLVLAVIGLAGLLSVSVAMRLRELAIRRALGASTREVVRGILTESASVAATGAAIGLAVALPLAWLARGLLPGVAPWDPVTLVGTALLLALLSGLTAIPSSLRAARAHPVRWLREE